MASEFVPDADAQEQAASVRPEVHPEVDADDADVLEGAEPVGAAAPDPVEVLARTGHPIDAPDADALEQAAEVVGWEDDDRG